MILGAENPCKAELQSSWAVAQEKARPQSDTKLSLVSKEGRSNKTTDYVCSKAISNPEKLQNLTSYWALAQLSR